MSQCAYDSSLQFSVKTHFGGRALLAQLVAPIHIPGADPGEATSKEQHLGRNAPNPTVWLPPFNLQEQGETAELTPCAQLGSGRG